MKKHIIVGVYLEQLVIPLLWVDSSKRRNDAENLTLLNKSFDVINRDRPTQF